MPKPFPQEIAEMMRRGVKEKVFPGAVLAVWHAGEVYMEAFGWQEILPVPRQASLETYYDLASLSKPLATGLCLMRLLAEGKIELGQRLYEFFSVPFWFKEVTTANLLSHSAGLPAHRPYFVKLITYPPEKRKDLVITWILKEPLAYPVGKKHIYSDLGFILLGGIIEIVSGKTLEEFFEDTLKMLGLSSKGILFRPKDKEQAAATEVCPWRGKLIKGEVHDENAWVLGGVAGHAGLFGKAKEILRLLLFLLNAYLGRENRNFLTQKIVSLFWNWHSEAGTWALAFDRPSPQGSSAGEFISRKALGHLGFTGTSFWIDFENELIVLLLSNRVHPHRQPNKLKVFRPALHDLIFKKIVGSAV
ncbi:beta-lactamase [Thermodesulfatator indicus DSM 15286]|uniref:Beta-lactamase n=1 Tax=Thermodesulfatator indicus (strain DSM 15286 / JCM 11887 / CIR29812) TaxID=667014 RepID=F8A936_THEID|nr:serine hydrolase [Thermodesulfatator indicus]AEH45164.1 beta-lactamase [Thermodesulfatator indicus DSM 15286]